MFIIYVKPLYITLFPLSFWLNFLRSVFEVCSKRACMENLLRKWNIRDGILRFNRSENIILHKEGRRQRETSPRFGDVWLLPFYGYECSTGKNKYDV
jgi:hypothetical protein